jgi:hypothetical protein
LFIYNTRNAFIYELSDSSNKSGEGTDCVTGSIKTTDDILVFSFIADVYKCTQNGPAVYSNIEVGVSV